MSLRYWTYENGLVVNKSEAPEDVYTAQWTVRHAKSLLNRQRVNYVLKRVKGKPIVLDYGCGSGILVDRLAKRGCIAAGVDTSMSNIDYAREHFKGQFVCGDVDSLIRRKWRFDVIILSHVLEHLVDPRAFLAKMKELLRKDGQLLIAVPNLWAYKEHSWREGNLYLVFDSTHCVAFSPYSLEQVLTESDYAVEDLATHTYRGDIVAGWVIRIGRYFLSPKPLSLSDKALVSKKTVSFLESVYSLLPCGVFNRLSERNSSGTCIIAVARRKLEVI
jgi:2-polyprenyl-3-methyl-5-hydroxy-6-metoxy-1,4-benzoquinol methylase